MLMQLKIKTTCFTVDPVFLLELLQIGDNMANNVVPNQTPLFVAFHLCLNRLSRSLFEILSVNR